MKLSHAWQRRFRSIRWHALLVVLLLLDTHAAAARTRTPAVAARVVVTMRTHSAPVSAEYALIKTAADAFNGRQRRYRVAFSSSLRRDDASWVHDAHAELSKAAARIDRQIAANRGHPSP